MGDRGDAACEEKMSLKDLGDAVVVEVKLDDAEGGEQGSENIVARFLLTPVNGLSRFFAEKRKVFTHIFIGILLCGFVAYFIAALIHGFNKAIPLIILTVMVLAIVLYEVCSRRVKRSLKASCAGMKLNTVLLQRIWRGVLLVAVAAFVLWLLISIIMKNPQQLVSLLGLGLIILVCFVFSKFPNQVAWRPVIWGIGIQIFLGLLVLRTEIGYKVVKFIGDNVATFMRYSDHGAKFVFDDDYGMHLFAFKILPMIVFFSTVMNMLYYLGLMQWFIGKLSWVTQVTLGTSAIESTVAAANIFVGMTEAPLVVRPYLSELTKSEIHSMLTCGLGSIAFSVFGAFVEFKVDSVHLLTACVMSAPAGLAVSRLLYPECSRSKFNSTDSLKLTGGTDRNVVEAAAVGASMSIGLVANIAANLIAFLALLAFVNAALNWFGAFVGYPDVTFQLLCGYLFMPLAFILGADWVDCGVVGELFGTKTFLNEFIAYKSMKPFIENRLSGDVPKFVNGSIQYMSERSEVVAIHALCGFCNVSSLGIIIGGLGSLMPERKSDLAELAVRAFMGGILTCCMTASIASLLFVESGLELVTAVEANATLSSGPEMGGNWTAA